MTGSSSYGFFTSLDPVCRIRAVASLGRLPPLSVQRAQRLFPAYPAALERETWSNRTSFTSLTSFSLSSSYSHPFSAATEDVTRGRDVQRTHVHCGTHFRHGVVLLTGSPSCFPLGHLIRVLTAEISTSH